LYPGSIPGEASKNAITFIRVGFERTSAQTSDLRELICVQCGNALKRHNDIFNTTTANVSVMGASDTNLLLPILKRHGIMCLNFVQKIFERNKIVMTDFAAARTKMVDNQIRTTDVTSHSILSAFLSVPREEFVPENRKALAYIDTDIEVAPGRFVMEPSPLAKLLQLAEITADDHVLEVGGASGYATAILAKVAKSVTSLESDAALKDVATATLKKLDYSNVSVVSGDLTKGHVSKGPYDVIFVNGAVEEVPAALLDQLKNGGRMVVVVGSGNASRARLYVRDGHAVSDRPAFNTAVKSLPGFSRKPEFVF